MRCRSWAFTPAGGDMARGRRGPGRVGSRSQTGVVIVSKQTTGAASSCYIGGGAVGFVGIAVKDVVGAGVK